MKHYDGIIWDLDGTLADTLTDLGDSVNALLAEAGRPPYPTEQYKTFVGNGAAWLLVRAFGLSGLEELPASLLDGFKREYDHRLLCHTKLYPYAAQWVRSCREAGMKTAVLTNKPEQAAQTLLHTLLADDAPELILGGTAQRKKKPAPDGIFEITGIWNIAPENCLYVGDSDVDMQTAQAAGMDVLAAGWGFRPSSELLMYCPTYYAPTAEAACRLMFPAEEAVNHAV